MTAKPLVRYLIYYWQTQTMANGDYDPGKRARQGCGVLGLVCAGLLYLVMHGCPEEKHDQSQPPPVTTPKQ